MSKLKPIIALAVLAAVAVVSVVLLAQRQGPEAMLGSGIVEADEYQISPKVAGRLAEVLVQEAEQVEVGRLLAVLEHDDLDAEVARAEAAVQTAEAHLRNLQRGTREEQIRAARARHQQAQAARAGAAQQLGIAQEGHSKVTELKQQADSAEARVQAAEAGVQAAAARLEEARRGPTPQEIETARAAVRQAEARLASARTALENARQVYAHQVAVEGPVIAASTEQSVQEALSRQARGDLARVRTLSEADAVTEQALDQTQTQTAVAASRLDGATRAVGDAQEQVALTRAQARAHLDAADSAVQEATRARDTAQAQLDVLLAGTRQERIEQARAALDGVEAEAEAARTARKHASTLYQDRLEARSKLQTARTALDTAVATERTARAERDLLLAGNTREVIEQAEGQVAQARATLQAAQTRLDYCFLRAPAAGTVTDVVAMAGELVPVGGTVMVLTDLDNLYLRAYLSLRNLGKVKVGQELAVTTDAAPQRRFDGRVVRISDHAEFTPKDVQTTEQRVQQVYWVKVGLGAGEGLLKPGMPADLWLPTTAAELTAWH